MPRNSPCYCGGCERMLTRRDFSQNQYKKRNKRDEMYCYECAERRRTDQPLKSDIRLHRELCELNHAQMEWHMELYAAFLAGDWRPSEELIDEFLEDCKMYLLLPENDYDSEHFE